MIHPATPEDQHRALQAVLRRNQQQARGERSPLGTYQECPLCGGEMKAEHAHYRCADCGWRDSCCND